ncbi:ArnT family glycosyltransferase [Roseibium marinum]|uniref:Dolichyl-phosphate-mannose-protein mannosyltransferase n=1 Tax=Roseibium marinum TaxID=281252 RepID=A0A2S3UXK7_9HYPH|nr:glycosyltransferase family 39 protein [Roseibium marinum]POF32414.1 dolichyl-phosphate-mannose-protein mannosyltransferase [Roseibium marinum]
MTISTEMRSADTPFYTTPLGVWSIAAAWGLAHLLLRALSTPVLGTDDMFENVLVQTLDPGYMLRQPPLYEWLLWSAQRIFGPTVQAALAVKYGLISFAALFLFLIARKAIADPRLAALCAFSYSLYYQFGWNLHEGVTHTVVLTAACAASAFFFVKALETGRLGFYVLFGLTAGAGLLGKHSYPLFALALILAALSDGQWRPRFRFAGLLLVPLAASLVYSPYAWWIASEGLTLLSSVSQTMGVTAQTSHIARVGEGLGKLGFGLIGFSVPLLPLLLLLFWPRYLGRKNPVEPAVNDVARLCGRTVLFMIALTALLILVTGATHVKERHMHPLLLLLPVFLFADLERFGFHRQWRWLGGSVAVVVAVAFLARVPGLVAPDKFWCGGKCRHMKPYADLKAPLGELGAANATLIADDGYTGGNLRVLFPDARIVTKAIAARTAPRDKCFFVWEDGESEPDEIAEIRFPKAAFWQTSDPVAVRYLSGSWPHLWKPEGWRTTWWGVAELDPSSPICR